MIPFQPFFRNPHLATIAGNYWRRNLDPTRFPVAARLFDTEPGVRVLVHSQLPARRPKAHAIIVHGLEGSSLAGYACSLAQVLLEAGFAAHRFNMRSCGGTENYSGSTLYHSGQTGDLREVVRQLRDDDDIPFFIIGFSLGGNVVLKLAGELADEAPREGIEGVCAVSAPIDLAECVRRLHRPGNWLYANRFLKRLKERIRAKERLTPGLFSLHRLPEVRTIYDFDDVFTAPAFGFGTADNYYATQSSAGFLERIRIPALLVQAKDDPLIPFAVFDHPAFATNSFLRLVAPDRGGHVGFIARGQHRFWVDRVIVEWMEHVGEQLRYPLQGPLIT
ncbi:MAG: alpha/beta fold hydrolase [Bryobacteraceae bacterium]